MPSGSWNEAKRWPESGSSIIGPIKTTPRPVRVSMTLSNGSETLSPIWTEPFSSRRVEVEIHPVQYNPASGSIRYLSEIELEVEFTGGDWTATRAAIERLASHFVDPEAAIPLGERQLKDDL